MRKALSDFKPNCRRECPRSGRENHPYPQVIELQAASCGLTPQFLPKLLRSPRPAGQGARLPVDKSCYAVEDK